MTQRECEHESCSDNERGRDREIKGESVCVGERGKEESEKERERLTERQSE